MSRGKFKKFLVLSAVHAMVNPAKNSQTVKITA